MIARSSSTDYFVVVVGVTPQKDGSDARASTPNKGFLQEWFCNDCYVLDAMQSTECKQRNAITVMQSMLCNHCDGINVMHSTFCHQWYAFDVMQRMLRNQSAASNVMQHLLVGGVCVCVCEHALFFSQGAVADSGCDKVRC